MTSDEVGQILRAIGNLEGKLTSFISFHHEQHTVLEGRIKSIEKRPSGNGPIMQKWEGARQLLVYLLAGGLAITLVILQAAVLLK